MKDVYLKIKKSELKKIFLSYYPTISHKNADRIIQDIEIQSNKKSKEDDAHDC